MRAAVYMEKCILGHPSWSVEGLGWLNNRLFSTGGNGELWEWDLKELKVKQTKTFTGYIGECIDVDDVNGCIAVGTREGYLNAFSVNGDDINHSTLFDKQSGPIYCCKYDSKGRFIVTGSDDTIRIFDVTTGHTVYKMSPSRSEKNQEVSIYSLVVLRDLTIIAGDVRGYITVWNGENGTHIDTISNALDAAVLTVAVNDDETLFCCSGVDPKIKIYSAVQKQSGAPRKWIRNFKRSVHDHSVKALLFMDEKKIVSGGVSGYIDVSCATKDLSFNQCQYGPFLPQPCAVVATEARMMLLKHFKSFEVWLLGTPNENVQLNDEDGNHQKKFLSMDKNHDKLLSFKSNTDEPINCASISPNGKFLIYSSDSRIRLYQVDAKVLHQIVAAQFVRISRNFFLLQTLPISLALVKVSSNKFTSCARVLFSSDSKYMYCVKRTGDIEIFSLSYDDDVDFKATISTRDGKGRINSRIFITSF